MHYYPFHLKDYLVETAHLPPMADLAYRRLLDLYYKTEEPIRNEPKWVANRIRMDGEEKVIGFVLREYFTFDKDADPPVWRHDTCDAVIAKYQKKAAVARANGVLHVAGSEKKPKSDADRKLTKNHKPRRNTPLPPEGVVWFEEFWNAYPRKAGKPQGMKAYGAALLRGATAEQILTGLKAHLPGWAQKKAQGEGDKIPHPATWLNRDGWTDEVMPAGGKPGDGDRPGQWWMSKQGLMDKGVELGIPGPADDSFEAFRRFKASVWVAAGHDGAWWDRTDTAYPLAVKLRGGGI